MRSVCGICVLRHASDTCPEAWPAGCRGQPTMRSSAPTPRPTPGTVYRDENGDLIWKCPCGSDNPLRLPTGRYIDKCPVCQKVSAPSREMRSPPPNERA
jgi:hypothetical protein